MNNITPTAGMMRPLMMALAPATSATTGIDEFAKLTFAAPPTSYLKIMYTVTSVERLSKKSEARHEKSPKVGLRLPQKGMPIDFTKAAGFVQSLT